MYLEVTSAPYEIARGGRGRGGVIGPLSAIFPQSAEIDFYFEAGRSHSL